MAESKLNGNCYLCGHTYSKAGFAKHILSNHSYAGADSQDCAVIKVEGADDKSYWLYVDIALTSTLQPLDSFLRDIWLECCGHLSNFYAIGIEQIGKSKKISLLPKGFTFYYDYDFGSTTTLKITVVGHSCRPRQRKAVRLLASTPLYAAIAESRQPAFAASAGGTAKIPFYAMIVPTGTSMIMLSFR